METDWATTSFESIVSMFETAVAAMEEATRTLPQLSSGERGLVEAAALWHRVEAAACARKLAYCGEVLDRHIRRGGNERPVGSGAFYKAGGAVDPFDAAEAEVSTALGVTPRAASVMLSVGHSLGDRLPNVWTAMVHGDLDLAQVRTIVDRTANVAVDHLKEVESRILSRALASNTAGARRVLVGGRLRAVIDKSITEVDPDGLRRRREAAQQRRHMSVRPAEDGMSAVCGSVRAEDGAFLSNRLAEMAKSVCKQDPRDFDARRADALMALVRGEPELSCECGHRSCPTLSRRSQPSRALVHVIVTDRTLAGLSEEPGWIDGYGLIDAEHAREISIWAKRRELLPVTSRVATERAPQRTNETPNRTEPGYRPSRATADWARATHGSCVFPNCDMPAWESDLDHRRPYDHDDPAAGGQTSIENLGPFCRKHHRLKTFGGWELERDEDGSLFVVSPLGLAYPCAPTGPVDLLTDIDGLSREPSNEDPKPKSCNRIEKRQARLEAERAANGLDDLHHGGTADDGDAAPAPF